MYPTSEKLMNLAKDKAFEYQNSAPFPNIVLENFFNSELLDEILKEFPDLSESNSRKYKNKREIKLQGKGELFFGDETKKFMHFLNSEPFLNFLQVLTGIEEKLVGDPYFIGGGQHETKKDGFLKIHADFNKHTFLGLDRRINVLIYLNKDWKDNYGGFFEMWDKEMKSCVKKVPPIFNTMAIFSTTDFSYHGLPDPLNTPEHISRKSLALYYYSNGRPDNEIINGNENHGTIFKVRDNNKSDKASMNIFNNPKLFIKKIISPFRYKKNN